jgi:SAM-dependent methyltransferase
MFDQTARYWQHLGENEPYWSILTADRFKLANIAATGDEFYLSGKGAIDLMRAFFTRNEQSLEGVKTVIELGCGVGRQTCSLSQHFERVIGVDVSSPHIELARKALKQRVGGANVELVQLATIDDLNKISQCDLFYSVLVLQHNPPPLIVHALDLAFDRVKPGGYALFQVPTFMQGYKFSWKDQLDRGGQSMEMHVLPQFAVYALLRRHCLELLEVHEDLCVGDPDIISNTFFARKSVG